MSDHGTLEEERDFLLRSLDDLDREFVAGDVDATDYATLRADYTRRAAAVLRAIESGRDDVAATSAAPRSGPRRLGVALGLVLLAAVAGILVAQSAGRRGDGGLTGLDVTAASSRLDACIAMERDDRPDDAMACYDEVLEQLPANVDALTLRGWLSVRTGDLAAGVADLDAAVQVDPGASSPLLFRAIGRYRAGDPVAAVADLAAFRANDPGEDELQLAAELTDAVVADALDRCIADDVAGRRAPVELLACYQDVLAVDGGGAVVQAYLGWLLARTSTAATAPPEVAERARRLLDGAVETDPDLAAARVFRAVLRAHEGDVAGARDDLDAVDALDVSEAERAAAADVRAALDAGRDPLTS